MNSLNEVRFKSRECKNEMHKDCHYTWHGLGLEFLCICECGHYIKKEGLEQFVQSECSNTSNQKQSVQQHEVAIR
jgi:hypothetical protein